MGFGEASAEQGIKEGACQESKSLTMSKRKTRSREGR